MKDTLHQRMSKPTDKEIVAAYNECARLTRSASSNFYIGFLALPNELRRAIYATYAFCRLCDDIVDAQTQGRDPSNELDIVHVALDNASKTSYAGDPIFIALKHTIERFRLNKKYYVDVIDGCRMDIETNRYESFDDLRIYCQKVASAVGIICISIFGHTERDAIRYADDLGIAFQLTNILRDIKEDYAIGRVYLPQAELRRFGVLETEFVGGDASQNFLEMMRFQLDRARQYYESGKRVIPMTIRGRQCLELMSGFYSRILAKIEERNVDVLSQRISLSVADKISITASTGWRWALRSVKLT